MDENYVKIVSMAYNDINIKSVTIVNDVKIVKRVNIESEVKSITIANNENDVKSVNIVNDENAEKRHQKHRILHMNEEVRGRLSKFINCTRTHLHT